MSDLYWMSIEDITKLDNLWCHKTAPNCKIKNI